MKRMKETTIILSAIYFSLVTATYSHAASTSKVFMSGTLVLLFLGFCALVLAIQLVPAMVMLYGMIKAAFEGKKEKSLASVKTR